MRAKRRAGLDGRRLAVVLAAAGAAVWTCAFGAGGPERVIAGQDSDTAPIHHEALPSLGQAGVPGERAAPWVRDRAGNLAELLGPNAHSGSSMILNAPVLNGAGVALGGADSPVRASLFASPLTSTDDLGMRRDAGLSTGVIASAAPLGARRDAFVLTAAYLKGNSGDRLPVEAKSRFRPGESHRVNPEAVDDDLNPVRRAWGEVQSVAAEGYVWDGRLHYRGEHARTTIGFDDRPESGIADVGRSLEANLSLWQRQVAGRSLGWYVGLEHQDVGRWFRSLSQPAAPSPTDARSAYSTWQWGGLGLDLAAGVEKENLGASEVRPAYLEDWQSATVRYRARSDAGRWYGRPSVNLTVDRVDASEVDVPDTYADVPYDARITRRDLSAGLRYGWGQLSVGYASSHESDATGDFSDYRRDSQYLKMYYRGAGGFSVRGIIRHGKDLDLGTGDASRQWRANLGLNWSIDSEGLDLKLRYGFLERRAGSEGRDDNRLSAEVSWQAIEPRARRAGLSLWFEAVVRESTRSDEYRVLAGGRLDYGDR